MDKKRFAYVDLILLFVAILWGLNPPTIKLGLRYITPVSYNFLRMIFSVVFCWAMVFITKTYKKIDKGDIKSILNVSVIGFFIFQFGYVLGVNYTTSGNASIIFTLVPISVIIVNKIFKIEGITLQSLIGIILTIIGVVVIVVGSGKEVSLSSDNMLGIGLLLMSQFAFGYYSAFIKPLVGKYSVYQLLSYILTITVIGILPFSIQDSLNMNWAQVPLLGWACSFYSGVFGLCIGNFLWNWGIKIVGSTKASIYNNISPVFALVAAYFMVGENFMYSQIVGAIIIFSGLYVTKLRGKNTELKTLAGPE